MKHGYSDNLYDLDESYGVEAVDHLEIDLADFSEFVWKLPMSVEEFRAGFHSRLDKLSDLQMNDKLKGHLLLGQAGLDNSTQNLFAGSAAGNYDIAKISSPLPQTLRDSERSSYASNNRGRRRRRRDNSRGRFQHGGPSRSDQKQGQNHNLSKGPRGNNNNCGRSVFYTRKAGRVDNTPRTTRHCLKFYSYNTANNCTVPGVIVDTGACSSVVGKSTLDQVMQQLGLTSIADANIMQTKHRFGGFRGRDN